MLYGTLKIISIYRYKKEKNKTRKKYQSTFFCTPQIVQYIHKITKEILLKKERKEVFKMKKTNGYKVDFVAKVITITKRFGNVAGVLGTPEFEVMQQLRKEYADYKVQYKTIERNENKQTYKHLTIDEMKRFLSTREDSQFALAQFARVENVVGNKKGKYAIIKKWFLKNYKEEYNAFLSLDIDKELAELENELEQENESEQNVAA